MERTYSPVRAVLGIVGLFLCASSAFPQTLGTAESFAVLGATTVTNTGPTEIVGDLGVGPGSAITGFPPGLVIGAVHAADAVALQAQADVTTAYNSLAGLPCDTDLTGMDLGSMTLTPGVYCFSSAAQLTGALTLDALGDPAAVFVFQIGSMLTTASNASVVMTNGGLACNVFWQVGSSAVLGTGTEFSGNILALASISLNSGTTLSGRAFARTGAVTLDANTISQRCQVSQDCPVITLSPLTLTTGVVGAFYVGIVSAAGSTDLPYIYAVSSGALPGGLSLNPSTGAITGLPTAEGQFIFTITATDTNGCPGSRAYVLDILPAGCPVITVSPATLPGAVVGTPYMATVSAAGSTALPYTFSVSTGALPDGLVIDASTGAITGTPTTEALVGFTITATDTNGCTGSTSYTVNTSPAGCPVITLSPSILPDGEVGIPYNQVISASPPGTYTFLVTLGLLPTGLSLNPLTGAITGTPTATGPFDFTITATDTSGCTGAQVYFVRILPAGGCPVITLSPIVLPGGVVGSLYNRSILASPPGTYIFSILDGQLPPGLLLNPLTGIITGTPTTVGSFNFTIAAVDASGCVGTATYAVTIIDSPATSTIPTLSGWALIFLAALLACCVVTNRSSG